MMSFALFVTLIALISAVDGNDVDSKETCGWRGQVCTDKQYCASWKRHSWCQAYRKEGQRCSWHKCVPGLDCHKGRCVKSECETNEDCPDSEKCNAGKCEDIECVKDSDCKNMDDMGVEGYCLKNVCMEYQQVNEPCSKKERCAPELNCRFNKQTREATCVECSWNQDCESGLCVENQCKECLIDNVGTTGVFENCAAVTKVDKKKRNTCVCSGCGSGFLLNKRSTCQACSLEDVKVDVPECVEVGLGFGKRRKEQCMCTKCDGEGETAKAVNGKCVTCWKGKFDNCAKVNSEDGCKCSLCARGWTFDENENCSVCDSERQYYKDGDKCVQCSLKTLFPFQHSKTCVGGRRESKTEIVDGTCKCKKCAENWTGDKCDVCTVEDMTKCGVCKDTWRNDFVPVANDAGVETCQPKTYNPPTNCNCVQATDDKDNVVAAECSIHAPLFHAFKAPWCFVDDNCQSDRLKESKRFNGAKWAWCE